MRRRRTHQGFAMIELLIAIVVLAIVMAAVAMTLGSTLRTARVSGNQSIGANLAAAEMDRLRSIDYASLPTNLDVRPPKMVDGINYTITDSVQPVVKNSAAGPCDAPSGSSFAYQRVTVTVTWPDMGGAKPITNETLITPPVGSYSTSQGHVGVKVRNRDGLAQSGVTVYLTNSSSVVDTEVTNSDGCAFFAYKAVGDYTVHLNTPGFVDLAGQVTTPTINKTITAGQIQSVDLAYDEAGALAITLAPADSSSTIPGGLSISLRNDQWNPKNRVFPGSGPLRPVTGLFPFADGYLFWAGECLDADPEGRSPVGVTYWPGESRGLALKTIPGTTATATVAVQSVRIRVRDKDGDPVGSGVSIFAVHAPDTGAEGCTGGSTLSLGTTDSNGEVNVAMPFGAWTFKANNPVSGPTITIYVGSTPYASVNVAPPADTATVSGRLP
jgi:prepilin-type N-terminal cleavage/methylation domain-containing protein